LKFKRQNNTAVDVNLTPLIDVVFLLLIFFMVSTSFIKETHLTLNLPSTSNARPLSTDVTGLEVIVQSTGGYSVADRPLASTDSETLGSALRNLAQEDFSVPLTITADVAAPYQSVVTLIDVAGQVGFSRIQITTQDQDTGE